MQRRDLLGFGLGAAAFTMGESALNHGQALAEEGKTTPYPLKACHPAEPLQALMDGNARFVAFEKRYRQAGSPRERERLMGQYWQDNCHLRGDVLANGQQPWAGIITCADSRLPTSWIFDVNPGQLFVVRSAGNTAFDDGVASMEYAVAVLGVPLIMVLGHSSCGAVAAALSDEPLTPLLSQLVEPIRTAMPTGGDVLALEQAIEKNVQASVTALTEKSDVLAQAVEANSLRIVGGVYNIRTGRVELV